MQMDILNNTTMSGSDRLGDHTSLRLTINKNIDHRFPFSGCCQRSINPYTSTALLTVIVIVVVVSRNTYTFTDSSEFCTSIIYCFSLNTAPNFPHFCMTQYLM